MCVCVQACPCERVCVFTCIVCTVNLFFIHHLNSISYLSFCLKLQCNSQMIHAIFSSFLYSLTNMNTSYILTKPIQCRRNMVTCHSDFETLILRRCLSFMWLLLTQKLQLSGFSTSIPIGNKTNDSPVHLLECLFTVSTERSNLILLYGALSHMTACFRLSLNNYLFCDIFFKTIFRLSLLPLLLFH